MTTADLKPKDFVRVFEAYCQVRKKHAANPGLKLPLLTFLLANGAGITGAISNVNFEMRLVMVLGSDEGRHSLASVIPFDAIIAIGFSGLDLCPEFSAALGNIP